MNRAPSAPTFTCARLAPLRGARRRARMFSFIGVCALSFWRKPAGEVLRSSVFVLPETIGFQECELAVCSHVLEEAGRRSSSVRLVKCFARSPQFVPMDSSVRNAQIPTREPRRPASSSSEPPKVRIADPDELFPWVPESQCPGSSVFCAPRNHWFSGM